MKRKLLLLVALVASAGLGNVQIVNIPDANFKNALVNSICTDTNGDGVLDDDVDANNDDEIQVAEALDVQQLFLRSVAAVAS